MDKKTEAPNTATTQKKEASKAATEKRQKNPLLFQPQNSLYNGLVSLEGLGSVQPFEIRNQFCIKFSSANGQLREQIIYAVREDRDKDLARLAEIQVQAATKFNLKPYFQDLQKDALAKLNDAAQKTIEAANSTFSENIQKIQSITGSFEAQMKATVDQNLERVKLDFENLLESLKMKLNKLTKQANQIADYLEEQPTPTPKPKEID